jgi:hypothetical protein
MPQDTTNHDLSRPDSGTTDWHTPINDNWTDLDTKVEIRDAESARSQYDPKQDAKFFATDTGAIYVGDGSAWQQVAVGGGGSGGAPTDAAYLTTASDAGLTNETVVSAYPFDASDLATDSVGAAELQADSVGSSELQTDSVTDDAIASDSVGNDELKSTVTTGDSEAVTASGDGTSTTFTLSHSLGAAPPAIVVEASSKAASTDFWISGGDSTQVEITYAIAPPSGTDNLSYNLSTGAGDPSSYTDSDAIDAVNNDTDHGSTAQHDYYSGNPSDLNQDGATVDDLLSWDGSQWSNIPSSTFLASDGSQSLSGNWDVGGFALSNVSALDTGRLSFDQPEETVVSGTTGSTYTIDVTNGSVFDLTLDADVTFSFTGGASAAGANSVTVILTQDSTGGRGVTWPSETQWSGGSEPSLSTAADATDIVTFVSPDQGTTWYGFLGGTAFA